MFGNLKTRGGVGGVSSFRFLVPQALMGAQPRRIVSQRMASANCGPVNAYAKSCSAVPVKQRHTMQTPCCGRQMTASKMVHRQQISKTNRIAFVTRRTVRWPMWCRWPLFCRQSSAFISRPFAISFSRRTAITNRRRKTVHNHTHTHNPTATCAAWWPP